MRSIIKRSAMFLGLKLSLFVSVVLLSSPLCSASENYLSNLQDQDSYEDYYWSETDTTEDDPAITNDPDYSVTDDPTDDPVTDEPTTETTQISTTTTSESTTTEDLSTITDATSTTFESTSSEQSSTITEEPESTITPTTEPNSTPPPHNVCNGGQEVKKPCPSGGGVATWFCAMDGNFVNSQPDYSQCHADWVDRIVHFLNVTLVEQNGILNISSASNLTSEMFRTLNFVRDNPNNSTVWYYERDILLLLDAIDKILHSIPCLRYDMGRIIEFGNYAIGALGRLLTIEPPWAVMVAGDEERKTDLISKLFQSFELAGTFISSRTLGHEILDGHFNKTFHNHREYLYTVGVLKNPENETLIFPLNSEDISGSSQIILQDFIHFDHELHSDEQEQEQQGKVESCIFNSGIKFLGISFDIHFARERFLEELLDENGVRIDDVVINSKLMSLSILNASAVFEPNVPVVPPPDHNDTDLNIIIIFEHDTVLRDNFRYGGDFILSEPICATWDFEDLVWRSEFCEKNIALSNDSSTTCICHKFAPYALFAYKHTKDIGLFLISILLGSLSCICLLITLVILHKSKHGNIQYKIAIKNIVVCLLIGNIFISLFMDPSIFKIPGWFCLVSGVVQHYIFLCSFVWMGIMSLRLYKMVFFIFGNWKWFTDRLNPLYGYGIPVLIVLPFASILREKAYSYEYEESCWLKGHYTWAFFGPMLVIYIVNLVLLVFTLRRINAMKHNKMFKKESNGKNEKVQRSTINGAFSLTVLLILPIFAWIPLYFKAIYKYPEIASYFFTMVNASQGIFIFVSQYLFQENFKTELRKIMNLKDSSASPPHSPIV